MVKAVTKETFFTFVTGKNIIHTTGESIEAIVTAERFCKTYEMILGFKKHLKQDYEGNDMMWERYGKNIKRAEAAYKSKNLEKFNSAVDDILLDIFYEQ